MLNIANSTAGKREGARGFLSSSVTSQSSLRFLIANDLHSREKASASKQSTYEFLIANEFHCADTAFRPRATLKLLDSSPSLTKHTTSQFLIDNLNGFSVKPFTLSTVEGSCPPQQPVHPEAGRSAEAVGTSNFEPLISRILIDNDMRSRKNSCHCKQSTYQFLIANEFQRAALSLNRLKPPFPELDSVPLAAYCTGWGD